MLGIQYRTSIRPDIGTVPNLIGRIMEVRKGSKAGAEIRYQRDKENIQTAEYSA